MSTIRIGGLASGLDTQAIIERILEAETRRITKQRDKKVELEAGIAIWSSVSADMSLLTDALYRLRALSTWREMSAISSDPTRLTASASGSALDATYQVAISQRAQAHSVASNSLSASDEPLVDIVVDLVADSTFKLGGVDGPEIEISAEDTLLTLATKINQASNTLEDDDQKILATIVDNRLILTRINTGSDEIVLVDGANSPLQKLGVLDGVGNWANPLIAAQNAVFTVNNAEVVRSRNTNLSDVISGVTLNLLGETATTVTLTVGKNMETPMAAINEFIAAYNVVAEKLEAFSNVDLTDPNNPQAGPLQGDPLAWNILRNMRRMATQAQDNLTEDNAEFTYGGQTGVANSLSAIGIGTSGTLNRISIVDADRLAHIMANHFDKVEQVFRGVYDEEVGANVGGVARSFYSYSDGVSSPISGEIAQRVNAIQNRIGNTETTIENLLKNLDAYEKRLWAQFGAMEEAIASMQQELEWLTSQLGLKKSG